MRAKTLIAMAVGVVVLTCGSLAWAAAPTEAGYDYSFEHAGVTYNFEYGYYLPGESYPDPGTNRYPAGLHVYRRHQQTPACSPGPAPCGHILPPAD